VSHRHAQEQRELHQQVQKLGTRAGHLRGSCSPCACWCASGRRTELVQRSALARAHGLLRADLAVLVRTRRACLPRPQAMYSLHWTREELVNSVAASAGQS
jgi:hypothetical protein